MYFCFDLLGQNAENPDSGPFETVAITCPNKKLEEKPKIRKCCPHGEVLDQRMEKCVGKDSKLNITDDWRIQINGHLYKGYDGPIKEKKILSPYELKNSSKFYVRIHRN